MSRELSEARSTEALVAVAVRHVAEVFSAEVAIGIPAPSGDLKSRARGPLTFALTGKELDAAEWVLCHDRRRGSPRAALAAAPELHQGKLFRTDVDAAARAACATNPKKVHP